MLILYLATSAGEGESLIQGHSDETNEGPTNSWRIIREKSQLIELRDLLQRTDVPQKKMTPSTLLLPLQESKAGSSRSCSAFRWPRMQMVKTMAMAATAGTHREVEFLNVGSMDKWPTLEPTSLIAQMRFLTRFDDNQMALIYVYELLQYYK